jgi:hypothetical protein
MQYKCKPKSRLFAEPLQFTAGELVLSRGYMPKMDRDVLAAHEIVRERFVSASFGPPSNAAAR